MNFNKVFLNEVITDIDKFWKNDNERGPDTLTISSKLNGVSYRAKLRCIYGHEWSSLLKPLFVHKKVRCEECCGSARKFKPHINDLSTMRPEVLSEWDYIKNLCDPSDVYYLSTKKFWWRCENGHESFNTPRNRFSGKANKISQCYKCSRRHKVYRDGLNLTVTNPDILKEWDYNKNTVTPDSLSYGSAYKAWWICRINSSHNWRAEIRSRIGNGNDCPYCSNQILDPEVNSLGALKPELNSVYCREHNSENINSLRLKGEHDVCWHCEQCNIHWLEKPKFISKRSFFCLKCNPIGSVPESELRLRFHKIYGCSLKEVRLPVKWSTSNQSRCDIVLEKENAVIEFDGAYWHKEKEDLDTIKTIALINSGWKVIRVRGFGLKPLTVNSDSYFEFFVDENKFQGAQIDKIVKNISTLIKSFEDNTI